MYFKWLGRGSVIEYVPSTYDGLGFRPNLGWRCVEQHLSCLLLLPFLLLGFTNEPLHWAVSSRKADPSSSQRAASWGKEAAEEAMKLETSTVSKL